MSTNIKPFCDKISLIKDGIKQQDEQLDKLEKGIDNLEYASETIKIELSNQNIELTSFEAEIRAGKDDVETVSSKVKKLYEKKSYWILTIGILIPLLIIIILAIVYT